MIITINDLSSLRKKHAGQKIAFCSGGFDLTHAGHVLFFEDCKKHGEVLVVMVGNDAAIRRDKGNSRPILNEHLRLKMIDSLKPVDYAFLAHVIPKEEHPLKLMREVFISLKPDAYVINEDAFDIPYRETFAKEHSVKLVILPRTCPPEFEKISTTYIIRKIAEEQK